MRKGITKQEALEEALRDIQALNAKYNNQPWDEMQAQRFLSEIWLDEDNSLTTQAFSRAGRSISSVLFDGVELDDEDL